MDKLKELVINCLYGFVLLVIAFLVMNNDTIGYIIIICCVIGIIICHHNID